MYNVGTKLSSLSGVIFNKNTVSKSPASETDSRAGIQLRQSKIPTATIKYNTPLEICWDRDELLVSIRNLLTKYLECFFFFMILL